MEGGTLQAQPLIATASFNWVFLVELIVCGILYVWITTYPVVWYFRSHMLTAGRAIFFLFYFNRVFATLVSYGIRAYTWHYYKVYVDFQALQISPLGGRIFFKGFRYHGANETILCQRGYVTWRYWLYKVQRSEYLSPKHRGFRIHVEPDSPKAEEPGDLEHDLHGKKPTTKKLPSRLELTLHGVEWFVYNRTAAYNSILEGFGHKPAPPPPQQPRDERSDEGPRRASAPETLVGETGRRRSSSGGGNNVLSRRSTAVSSLMNKCCSIKEYILSFKSSSRPITPSAEPLNRVTSSQAGKAATARSEASVAPSAPVPGARWLELLPVDIVCYKGAFVMGNENTQAIMSTSFDSAHGKLNASNAGPEDYYKLIIDLQFTHPVLQMRPNPDFKHLQITLANQLRLSANAQGPHDERKQRSWGYHRKLHKIYHGIRDVIPYFQSSVESFHFSADNERPTAPSRLPGASRWQGLSRYREDEVQDEHEGWQFIEYGRCSTLIDAPLLRLCYYWDIAGKVTYTILEDSPTDSQASICPINGSEPPEWGLHLSFKGGTINYGPWADRQRAGIQSIFFPNPYRSSEQAHPLSPGDDRQATVFKLTIDFEEETVLRLPTREPSKDWLWKDQADAVRRAAKKKKDRHKKHPRDKDVDKGGQGPDIRPYGWLSLYVDGNSSLSYTMGMVALDTGTSSELVLDFRGSRLMSSVNHGLLWKSGHQTVRCDLSTPLQWNALRNWTFDIVSDKCDLFLLRDHTYLIADLINDWSSGPSADYYTFVPANYNLNLTLNNIRVYLNVNDQNIIDSPTVVGENAFLIIKGKQLRVDVGIPLSEFQAPRNTIPMEFDLSDATIDLSTPMWNTYHTFLEDQCVASLARLTATGGYTYHSTTAPGLSDAFDLDIDGISPRLYLYGFLIRYFLLIKANYFGDHVHFKTSEEFRSELRSSTPKQQPVPSSQRKSNDLDVHIQINGVKPCVLIPSHIYDKKKCFVLNCPAFELDIRATSYYMDFQTTVGPLGCTIEGPTPYERFEKQVPQLFIDGVSVYGHRIFGPPPNEEAYVCNWDVDIGDVTGECSTSFVQSAVSALRILAFTIDDGENALPPKVTVAYHDVSFIRAVLRSIRIWVLVDRAALLLSLDQLEFSNNDWIGSRFSSQTRCIVPNVILAAVERKQQAPQFLPQHLREPKYQFTPKSSTAKTYGYFEATIDVTVLSRKPKTDEEKNAQQRHLTYSDSVTARATCLVREDGSQEELSPRLLQAQGLNAPSIPLPSLPEPLQTAVYGYADGSDLASSRRSSQTVMRHGPENTASRQFRWSAQSFGDRNSLRGNIREADVSSLHETSSIPSVTPRRRFSRDSANTERKVTHTRPYQTSSWARPDFAFHRVQPDTTHVPRLPQDFEPSYLTSADTVDGIDIEFTSEDEDVNHHYVICTLTSGLRGFCAPEALTAISSFADEFNPSTPIDVLDSLHAGVMSDILQHEKAISRSKVRSVTSYSAYLPVSHVRIVNATAVQDGQRGGVYRDQYDIKLSSANVMFRLREETREGEAQSVTLGYAARASAATLALGAKGEQIDAMEKRGIFQLRLDKVSLALTSEPLLQSKARIQNFDTISSTKTVGDIVALVERSTRMADVAIIPLQEIKIRQEKRLRYLIHYLSFHGLDSPDPRFLTRPSYVLRAAGNHLRLHESWKILARLRNTLNIVSRTGKTPHLEHYRNFTMNSAEARLAVIANLEKWKTWDYSQVQKSHVMRAVFGESRQVADAPGAPRPLNLYFSLGTLRFCLDPGPRETFLFFENLTTAVRVDLKDKRGSQPLAELLTQEVVVQLYCSKAELTIRWEVCELLEDILTNIEKFIPKSANAFQEEGDADPDRHIHLHVIFMADRASVVLDCINVVIFLVGNGLKGSLIEETPATGLQNNLSVMVDGDTASVEFKERTKRLMIWRLTDPKYYVSHTWMLTATGRRNHNWKTAAASQKVRYDLEEDPLGMLHVINKLLDDEVRWVINLVRIIDDRHQSKFLSKNNRAVKPPVPQEGAVDVHRFQVVTLLKQYEIRLALLPSVHLIITGEVSRLSVAPGADPKKLTLDFDIKTQRHVFKSLINGRSDVITSVDIPPINGRVALDMHLPSRTEVDVDTTIELINVDAGDVRNLLTVVRAPELTHLLTDVRSYLTVLHVKFNSIVPTSPALQAKPSDENGAELAYWIRITMAGIDIHSVSPGLNSSYVADMIFSTGMISAHMENADDNGVILQHSEFHVRVLRLSLDLTKREGDFVQSCGAMSIDAQIFGTSRRNEQGALVRTYHMVSQGLQIELLSETASMAVDIAAYLRRCVETLDLSNELKRLRRLKLISSNESSVNQTPMVAVTDHDTEVAKHLFESAYSIDLNNISIAWIVSKTAAARYGREPEDLVFSIRKIDLATKKEDAARLKIADIQLQIVPPNQSYSVRSLNSILLPEVVFNAAYTAVAKKQYRHVYQAAGKALDIRLTSDMIFAASLLQTSIIVAKEKLQEAKNLWKSSVKEGDRTYTQPPSIKPRSKIVSLRIDAEFAGAVFNLQGRADDELPGIISPFRNGLSNQPSGGGHKYGPYSHDEENGDPTAAVDCTAIIRVPGLQMKAQYDDTDHEGSTINAEILILSSNNTLYPPVVSLVNQVSSNVQEVVRESNKRREKKAEDVTSRYQTSLLAPTKDKETLSGQLPKPPQKQAPTVLGQCKLNIGLRMRRQEFTLSCQPIARVLASGVFESAYFTLNTVNAKNTPHFLALVLDFKGAAISVKHVYSNDSTASLAVDSTVVSLMNSKYVGSDAGLSAILKLSPVKAAVDIRQVQDFLLFGEIWFPPTEKGGADAQDVPTEPLSAGEHQPKPPASPKRSPKPSPSISSQGQMVQKYHHVATQSSFPWNSVVSIESVDVELDLGQALGRSSIIARDLWLSSKKSSDWEQHLCVGLSGIEFVNKGRLDAEIILSKFRVHSAIKWPAGHVEKMTPLIQASASVGKICGKAAFEYQEFLIADITGFHFAMYNVRNAGEESGKDRLIATLEGEKVYVFLTTMTASLSLSLYQTLNRLVQGKKEAYRASVKEIERFIRRQSSKLFGEMAQPVFLGVSDEADDKEQRIPLSLHTDVLVNLQLLHIGVFPNVLDDHQIFKIEGLDFETRFSVLPLVGKIRSGLRLELGQLRVALSQIERPPVDQPNDVNMIITSIAERSRNAKGGIILQVPKVVATMSTWQALGDNLIEYIFHSQFQGKVDVGWNYSRISFIRNMWTAHSRALAARLGKPLRQPAVQITSAKLEEAEALSSGPARVDKGDLDSPASDTTAGHGKSKEKITAVVNVPLSKYRYEALEPPVIDTPQLRDMGEATPPLEWIGLNREKLPHVVHQIVIVTLTEVATDVEDAYLRILGSSNG